MFELDFLDQLLALIAAVRFSSLPFPTFELGDVFSEGLFAAMIDALPDPRLYRPRDNDGRPVEAAQATRGVLPLTAGALDHLGPARAGLWAAVGSALVSRRFTAALFDCIQPHLPGSVRERREVSLAPSALLCHFNTGYALGPHTDSPHKLATMIFYLGPRGAPQTLGTAMYTPKDPAFRCAGGPHYAFDAFERLRVAPFVPNSVFGFVRTDVSFHGVEPAGGGRDTLAYTLALA